MENTLESPALASVEADLEAPAENPGETAKQRGKLESTALHATLWTVLDYGAGQSLRLVNSWILTRLLVPAAFGEMTLVMTLIVGISLLSDIGLAPSVIQSPRGDEPKFLNAAFSLQALRGGILWVLALALAWPAAWFYGDRSLLYVLPVLALTVLIDGVTSTNMLSLSRHMEVRRIFAIDFTAQILQLVVTIAWAYWHPSVWALVLGNLTSKGFKLAVSHSRMVPGACNRFEWDRDSIKSILHFGKWIFLGTALFFFASQADRLILGKKISFTQLGVYGIAFSLSDIPRSVIGAFSYKVGYPFIAKIIHLPLEQFRVQFLRYRGYTLYVGGFLLAMMVIFGGDVVKLVYKPAYHDAAWMVPILAAGLWHTLLYQTTSPVLFSLGKSKYNAAGNAAYCAAILIGIPVAFHYYGLLGAVVAVAAGDLPLYVVTQFGAVRERVRPLRQDGLMTLAFLATLAVLFALRHLFVR